jgi:hypothetical protein
MMARTAKSRLYYSVMSIRGKHTSSVSSWALIRQRGRRHFIITRGMLLRGLPLGLCLFALHVWLVEPRDVLLAFMYVPGFLFFGWLYGDYLWHRRERTFEGTGVNPGKLNMDLMKLMKK